MNRLLCGFLLIAFVTVPGCTTCCYKANDQALSVAEPKETFPQRSKVYVFLINGFDPLHVAHIESLQQKLNCRGFAKVYLGEFYHQAFLEKEIRKIHCEEPDARFIVVGYSIGAGVAQSLVTRITGESILVDALVEIAPVYFPQTISGQQLNGVGRHLILGTNSQLVTFGPGQAELISLTGVRHYAAPTNLITVETIVELANMASHQVPITGNDLVPQYPLVDNPAPLPGQNFVVPREFVR